MHSTHLVGRRGVPVICGNLDPDELRKAIQPDNDREEFLLLVIEEQALRLVAAKKLGEDYDEGDDDEYIAEKLSLAEKVARADLRVSQMLGRMDASRKQINELLSLIKSALLDQSMVASQEVRLDGLLKSLSAVRELAGSRWDDLKP